MRRTALLLLLPSFLLFGSLACGGQAEDASASTEQRPEQPGQPSTGGAVTGTQLAATLDACALPKPCAWPLSTGSGEDKSSIRCVIDELAAGRSLSVETSIAGDGPSNGCEVKQGLHFFAGSNVAYFLWRKKCGATEEHALKKCAMLDSSAYASCLTSFDASTAKPDGKGFRCSLPSDWMSACAPVEQAVCPK